MQRYIISRNKVKGEMHVTFRNGKDLLRIEISQNDVEDFYKENLWMYSHLLTDQMLFISNSTDSDCAEVLAQDWDGLSTLTDYINNLTDAQVAELDKVETQVVHLTKTKAA